MESAMTLDRIPLYWIQLVGGGIDHWYLCPDEKESFKIYAVWHR